MCFNQIPMNKIFFTPLFVLVSLAFAQKHEIGIFIGGANAISDVGRTNYVLNPLLSGNDKFVPSQYRNTIPIVFGGMYKYNLNPQQGIRINLNFGLIKGNDANATEEYRIKKDQFYNNSIIELSTVFEYDFFPINQEQQEASSPYIFAGIGAFGAYSPVYEFKHELKEEGLVSSVKKAEEFKGAMSIPFGIGYKIKFNWNWIISAEVGFRPTFIDYLDKSISNIDDVTRFSTAPGVDKEVANQRNAILKEQLQQRGIKVTGNKSSNDWYTFTGISLRYTFGRPPCFCD